MTNPTLTAVPLFVFMGIMLEKSKLAEQLLGTMDEVMRGFRGGLGLSVILVGALLAASTGIVGATVVTMGLLALPTMLKQGYCPKLATGTICAAGTLGQIIPPSIILILLGDVLSSAYQQAQLEQGIFSPETLSVGDLFVGRAFPGHAVGGAVHGVCVRHGGVPPAHGTGRCECHDSTRPGQTRHYQFDSAAGADCVGTGSILGGFSTPTEAASLGALGAMLLAAAKKRLNLQRLQEVMRGTLQVSSMIS